MYSLVAKDEMIENIYNDNQLIKINTINPATEEVIKTYDVMNKSDISKIVKDSRKSFYNFKNMDIKERVDNLINFVNLIKKNKKKYALLITREMGKPITQSLAEIDKCIWICEYFIEFSASFLENQNVNTEYHGSYISFEPLGVVGCLMPWNFPFLELIKFAIPAMMAGNTVILKHSKICIGCSLEMEKLFIESRFPKNSFKVIIGDHDLGEYLLKSDIDAISVTSSVETGKKIAMLASKRLKKFVLELGGSDPFIVLDDANLEQAVDIAIKSRFLNTGQSCNAAKRFIVMKKVFNDFVELFLKKLENQVIGDPCNQTTSLGPIVRNKQRKRILDQIKDSELKGGNIITGGKTLHRKGFFMEPTVITDVQQKMQILKEEVFGPVAPIMVVGTEKEAISKANKSQFGLGASVWTKNIEKGIDFSKKIEAGMVSINEMVKSDPRMPFGGIKKSGLGRELSQVGIKEFVNIKSVIVKKL